MTPLRKRGSTWFLDVRVSGKRHRLSLGTDIYFKAIDKARTIERELGKQAALGTSLSLEDIASKYRVWAKSSHPTTAPEEAGRLRWILDSLAKDGIERLDQITTFHIEALRGRLRDKKIEKGRAKSGLQKSTINRYMQILRALFYRAAEWGDYHGENPLRRVKFYREEQNLRPLTPEETTAILEAARAISKDAKSPLQKCFADLCEFALNTGMRKSEILGLKWNDIRAGEAIIKGKGDKRRAVPLNRAAKAVVDRQDRGRAGQGAEFVFDIPNRQQPDLFRRTTFQISKAAKVKFNFHLLRHACATRMLERGVDVVTISAVLGHSRSMTTLLYSHTDASRKRKAVEALDGEGSRP